MDREQHLRECLSAHRDLLKIEREVHEWISGLTGIEWVEAPARAPPTRRPARPVRSAREERRRVNPPAH